MIIAVNLMGPQRKKIKKDALKVSVADNSKISDIVNHINARYPDLKISGSRMLVTINDRTAALDDTVKENDAVSFLPLFGGG